VCKGEVKQVFDVLADDRNWPVLVHCTQGKDRTGLIVMLVLFLLAFMLYGYCIKRAWRVARLLKRFKRRMRRNSKASQTD
jgi:protein tyrosine/serine phosphatase